MTIAEEPRRDPATDDALGPLLVLDRLEVGPVRLEPRRLTAPYRVTRDGASRETELIFRWEEPVFEPERRADQNLALLVAAQVALNYGLFCREIVFHGELETCDRRFLAAMLENTAREIYVLKIHGENPFLAPEVRDLPVVRLDSYVQARLLFDGTDGDDPGFGEAGWATSPDRWAVLSSGGKDSLLSYGLLKELGCDPHPLFVNESGRHWFTALRAFRRFRDERAHTARVWTNADRVFSWMLRQLPFVRPDFHRVRADIYPIRLWTVAVFVFSVLPLLRRRRIGRLVVGDEYDTTVRRRFRGIPHYDGLFDQSRFFDHDLSRLFAAKGWGVVQLSLLRPLSELMIETILARRYPELLCLQVSCHAAHREGDDVIPCGRCEKCRRIVAMLLAAGADPGLCGYDRQRRESATSELVARGVHQESEGVAHLAAVLHEKALIDEPRLGKIAAKRHPEIVSLRFHPERSPVAEVPIPIRKRLYGIYREHAEGALARHGRAWIPIDLDSDPSMTAPAPHERAGANAEVSSPRRHLWGELTWPEAEQALGRVDLALLPVGAIEQHGPHLPLDTDSFDAEYSVLRVAEACSEPRPLVLPLVPYGVSYHHDDFPGTLSVTNETLARFVYEVGMAAARNGIRKLVIVNGHGGNSATLHFAAQMINRDAHIFTCVETGETSDEAVFALAETPNDVHAGEIETSTTLATRPELVRMDLARPFVPDFSSRYLDFTSKHAVGWYARTAKISESGVFGDPTKATREKGEAMWKAMIEHLVELVEHLKGLTLEEIYERRN